MRYLLNRWTALTRYLEDGRLEIDNNAVERALRAVANHKINRIDELLPWNWTKAADVTGNADAA
ncbi:hypothetical protein FE88_28600 [Azospirillum brasilense]|nr:hypothetical protein AMK58_13485 [Azospirillum brasilense]OPH12282.1 hypothetical protein FE89_28970 [Azospirillum brasilense]OPH17960.1 hypothetical protein FE88_28600 [Azospirillum brasilense]TVZ60499.1 transposase IS66 family protein [Azospirillum brasilense]TWB83545.1 transposase IS66 family protein [Azospirillum brasilense]